MILYKYFSSEDFASFIEKPRLNFTPPKYFNDPFEVTSSFPNPDHVKRLNIAKEFTDDVYQSNYYVLCLTRSPLNKLMWSHYCRDHKGIVVGFDVKHDVFINLETCTIPVQFGNVIYTATKPNQNLIAPSPKNHGSYSYPSYNLNDAEWLQRQFLSKSLDWAYEEEVRIVKIFGNTARDLTTEDPISKELTEHFEILNSNQSLYYKFMVPNDCVREIYFGMRNDNSMAKKAHNKYQGASFFKCFKDPNTYNLTKVPICDFSDKGKM